MNTQDSSWLTPRGAGGSGSYCQSPGLAILAWAVLSRGSPDTMKEELGLCCSGLLHDALHLLFDQSAPHSQLGVVMSVGLYSNGVTIFEKVFFLVFSGFPFLPPSLGPR